MKKLILLTSIIMLAVAGKTQGQTLTVGITHVDSVLCYGMHNGSITVAASAGTPPYSYLWSTSQTNSTITGLPAGTYTVTVTDAAANTAMASALLTQPTQLTSHVTAADTITPCYGNNNGTITIAVVGGTPPWTYHWSNGDSTLTIMNLTGGLYDITITDHNGCTNVHSIVVSQPSELIVQIQSHDATCSDTCNGEVTSAVTGGTPYHNGYSYMWSNNQTTANISNLCPGVYDLTVTDSNGCQKAMSATVVTAFNAYFIIYPDSTTPHHYFVLNESTGIPPISYLWNWGDGTHDTTAYPTHTYSTSGNYLICLTVRLSTDCCCGSTYCDSSYLSKSPNSIISVTVVPGPSGIKENELSGQLKVYPNPATDKLQIQTDLQLKDIEVADITGRLLYITTAKTIDCSGFANGVYFIRATTEKGIIIKKFIKE